MIFSIVLITIFFNNIFSAADILFIESGHENSNNIADDFRIDEINKEKYLQAIFEGIDPMQLSRLNGIIFPTDPSPKNKKPMCYKKVESDATYEGENVFLHTNGKKLNSTHKNIGEDIENLNILQLDIPQFFKESFINSDINTEFISVENNNKVSNKSTESFCSLIHTPINVKISDLSLSKKNNDIQYKTKNDESFLNDQFIHLGNSRMKTTHVSIKHDILEQDDSNKYSRIQPLRDPYLCDNFDSSRFMEQLDTVDISENNLEGKDTLNENFCIQPNLAPVKFVDNTMNITPNNINLHKEHRKNGYVTIHTSNENITDDELLKSIIYESENIIPTESITDYETPCVNGFFCTATPSFDFIRHKLEFLDEKQNSEEKIKKRVIFHNQKNADELVHNKTNFRLTESDYLFLSNCKTNESGPTEQIGNFALLDNFRRSFHTGASSRNQKNVNLEQDDLQDKKNHKITGIEESACKVSFNGCINSRLTPICCSTRQDKNIENQPNISMNSFNIYNSLVESNVTHHNMQNAHLPNDIEINKCLTKNKESVKYKRGNNDNNNVQSSSKLNKHTYNGMDSANYDVIMGELSHKKKLSAKKPKYDKQLLENIESDEEDAIFTHGIDISNEELQKDEIYSIYSFEFLKLGEYECNFLSFELKRYHSSRIVYDENIKKIELCNISPKEKSIEKIIQFYKEKKDIKDMYLCINKNITDYKEKILKKEDYIEKSISIRKTSLFAFIQYTFDIFVCPDWRTYKEKNAISGALMKFTFFYPYGLKDIFHLCDKNREIEIFLKECSLLSEALLFTKTVYSANSVSKKFLNKKRNNTKYSTFRQNIQCLFHPVLNIQEIKQLRRNMKNKTTAIKSFKEIDNIFDSHFRNFEAFYSKRGLDYKTTYTRKQFLNNIFLFSIILYHKTSSRSEIIGLEKNQSKKVDILSRIYDIPLSKKMCIELIIENIQFIIIINIKEKIVMLVDDIKEYYRKCMVKLKNDYNIQLTEYLKCKRVIKNKKINKLVICIQVYNATMVTIISFLSKYNEIIESCYEKLEKANFD